jgi:hypothetical protein
MSILGVARSAVLNCFCYRFVTIAAGMFRDRTIARRDAQRIWKPARRKKEGVPKAVSGLGEVFPNQIVRGMTVIAHSRGSVARFQPCIVMLLHDVAVRACRGIVG